ncbi:MAG TPA: type II secretion system F family protein [Nocardioidaceae bacterium]|nr:type II secretion system F family protein [Nocardioidaceae bacterium]
MNGWVLLFGAGIGLGIARLVWLLAPRRVDMVGAAQRWEAARATAAVHTPPGMVRTGVQAKVGRMLAVRLGRHGVQMQQIRQDLAMVNRDLEGFLVTTTLKSLAGLVLPSVLFALLQSAGASPPPSAPLVFGVIFAVGFVFVSIEQLHREANDRRDELRRTLSTYLDLVAMAMAGGRGHPEALPMAAQIGSGWTFELLEDTVVGARDAGTTPWAALGELGRRCDISELRDLAVAVTLVADNGARVRETLMARAESLRQSRITAAKEDAQKRSDSIEWNQLVIAGGFVVWLFYPTVVNLFNQ